MQRLTRQSSALSSSTEYSGTGIRDTHEDGNGEPRHKKRPTAEEIHSDELSQSKRARRERSTSKVGNGDVGDFIVVSSEKPSQDLGAIRNKKSVRDDFINSPDSSISSLGPFDSAVTNLNAVSEQLGISDRSKNINDTSTTTRNVSEDSNALMDSPGGSSQEIAEQTSLSINKDTRSNSTLEKLDEKLIELRSSDLRIPSISNMIEPPVNRITVTNPWVSVNNPNLQQPLGTDNAHGEPHAESPPQQKKGTPIANKRTPLPAEKVDSQISNVLSSIPRDPRYAATKAPRRTFSSGSTNSSASGIQPNSTDDSSTQPKDSEQPAHATALSLQNLYSLVSTLDSRAQFAQQSNTSAKSPNLVMDVQTTSRATTLPQSVGSDSVEHGSTRAVFQETPSFSIFPSKFQVHTTDSISQSSGPKRRYRRKNQEETQQSTSSVRPSDRSPRISEKEPFPNTALMLGSNAGVKTEDFCHTQPQGLPPLQDPKPIAALGDSASSPLIENKISHSPLTYASDFPDQPIPQINCPPALKFTVDNRAESNLPASDVTSLFATLSKNASVLIIPNALHSSDTYASQPIGILMWQTLSAFYSWYSNFTGIEVSCALKFELMDVHWQSQKSFVLPLHNADYFRALKQYIWDLYWTATSINHGALPFRVSIAWYPREVEHAFVKMSEWSPKAPHIAPNYSQSNHTLPSIDVLHEVPDEPRSHAINDSLSRYISSHRRESSGSGSKPGMLAISGLTSSSAASPASISPSSATRSLHRVTEPTSWHSHRMPNQTMQDTGKRKVDKSKNLITQSSNQSSFEYTRTDSEKLALRKRASELLPQNMELFPEESSVYDKFPYKNGGQVLGAIIDKMSGLGMVEITGKGYLTLKIPTGPEEVEDRYQRVHINLKQTCMLHKGAIVLYYKNREPSDSTMSPQHSSHAAFSNPQSPPKLGDPSPTIDPKVNTPPAEASQTISPKGLLSNALAGARANDVDICMRLQIERSGKFSVPYDKSYLRPSITAGEFFAWFGSRTGYAKPGPSSLKFTFKDAMPVPTSTQIMRGNEDHFKLMRKDIKVQCTKAKAFMPDLKEFVILITVPGWDTPSEEEW